jgi:hypothetical protein
LARSRRSLNTSSALWILRQVCREEHEASMASNAASPIQLELCSIGRPQTAKAQTEDSPLFS